MAGKLVLSFVWKNSGFVKFYVRKNGSVYLIDNDGTTQEITYEYLCSRITRNHLEGWSYSMKFIRKNFELVKRD